MKKLLVLLLALLLLLSLFGCKKAPAVPLGILVEGVFYLTGRRDCDAAGIPLRD